MLEPWHALLAFGTGAGLAGIALHIIGQYGTVHWWDDVGHALSGFAVATGVFLAASQLVDGVALVPLTLGGVLVVGLAWEAFEIRYFGERAAKGVRYWREDTKLDLVLEVGVTLILLLVDTAVPLHP